MGAYQIENPELRRTGNSRHIEATPQGSLTVALMSAAFVFLYLNLFYLPFTPIYLFVDQVTQLYDARRMLDGLVIYKDFFQVTPPGTQAVYLILFKLFGVHTWIPNVMLIVLGLSIMGLMVVIGRKVVPAKTALLAAALFLVIPFRSQFDATHHWYSTVATLGGLALVIEARTWWRVAAAGGLFGLSSCFTQMRGLPAIIAVALFLLWESRLRRQTWRCFWKFQLHLWWPFGAVLVGFNAYFAWQAGLSKLLYDTVVFGLRYYPAETWNTYRVYMIDVPRFHPWYRLPALAIFLSIHLLIPLIYILFFVRYWSAAKQNPIPQWDRLMLLSLTGLFLFLGMASAPSWLRICAVSPPGVILFAWFWNSPGKFHRHRIKAIWIMVMLLAIGECAERGVRWHRQINLPIGRVAMMNPDHYASLEYFLRRTKPGDYFFGDEMFNYLLDLRDPAVVPYVTGSDYTRPLQVENVIEGLKTHRVKFALWANSLDLPPPRFGGKNNLAPLRHYLERYYHYVDDPPNGMLVLERNADRQ